LISPLNLFWLKAELPLTASTAEQILVSVEVAGVIDFGLSK
jgi:hypothetical protein